MKTIVAQIRLKTADFKFNLENIVKNINSDCDLIVFPQIDIEDLGGKDMVFEVPEGADVAPKDREKAAKLGYVGNYTRLGNACWFTNINHGRRHQPLSLMTMADNMKFSKHKQIREKGYQKYDNYDAIEVPFNDAIPSDYDGAMGVPITFMDKYCPEQFEIIWQASGNAYANAPDGIMDMLNFDPTIKYGGGLGAAVVGGKAVYSRILIKRKDVQP